MKIKFLNKDLDISGYDNEYYECVKDLIINDVVLEMGQYIHHGETTCLEHCINVSYSNYKVCKLFGLDYKSASRAGLLHDLFLYDWRINKENKEESKKIFEKHGFTHSKIALQNAIKYFELNKKEKDMILKHMWPLNIKLPKYAESYVIVATDKYCCLLEIFKYFVYKEIFSSVMKEKN